MKTININLIGNTGKLSIKPERITEQVDDKVKTISVIAIIGACVVFVISASIWSIFFFSAKKTSSELAELKIQHEKLKEELAESSLLFGNLLKEKKILELKYLAKSQIEANLLPWYNILTDVSNTVPKNVKVNKILKATKSSLSELKLSIEGQINANKKSDKNPLDFISFFVLNINENPALNTYLSEAVIKTVDHDEKSGIYNFTIGTGLKLDKKEAEKKQEK